MSEAGNAGQRASRHSETRRFYDSSDVAALDYAARIGGPGEFPYTRGVKVPRIEQDGWIQRELSGEGRPSRSNAQFKELLKHGQQGLDIIGDAPTAAYMDPDHPYAKFAVGTQGVSLCRLQDYIELYDGIALEGITLSHSIQPLFCVAGLYAVAKHRGIEPAVLRGSVINAPYFAEDSGYAVHLPFELRVRMATDAIAFATKKMPRFHSFLEDTYFFSDGGLDPVSEVGLGLLEIRGITREMLGRGFPIDSFAPRIAMLVNCGMDLFTEIAKVRAVRRVFAYMMRDEFGAQDPRSMALNVAVHTSGMSLTAQQPINNIVRATSQALAMALAGVQGIEVSTFDEAFRTPTALGHKIGLRTQQILALEAGLGQVVDPLGGSFYVESLTDRLCAEISEFVQRTEAMGDPGALSAKGYFRDLFVEGMARQARDIAEGNLKRVGVNCYLDEISGDDALTVGVAEIEILPDLDWIRQIREWRAARDSVRLREGLHRVREACDDRRANLVPSVVLALESDATVGEIVSVLRESYGMPGDPLGGQVVAEELGRPGRVSGGL